MKRTNKQINTDIKNGRLANTSNDTPLNELFEKRDLYKSIFDSYNIDNIQTINLWDEKTLYGKLNHQQQPVIPIYSKLKSITNNLGQQQFCVAPAADAFNDMLKSINYDFNLRKIKNSSYYPIVPKNSTINCISDLNKHLVEFFNYYSTDYVNLLNKKKKINNFDDYINSSIDLINLTNIYLTLSNFLLKQSPLTNGLTIDITLSSASDDQEKQILFLEDQNFSYILSKAEQFGFYIDKNIPWRFVFNISSQNSQKYLNAYNVTTLKEFFDTFYTKTLTLELEFIKQQYVNSYNNYIILNPEILDECNNYIGTKRPVTLESVNDNFRWSKFHYFLKLKELNKIKNNNQYNQFFDNFIALYNLDKDVLIDYIEKTTKPVFGGGSNPYWLSPDLTTRNVGYKINFKF